MSGYGPPQPFLATAFLAGQAVVLLTLGLLLEHAAAGDRLRRDRVVLFGLGWMAGVFAGVGGFFERAAGRGRRGARVVLPSDGLWRGMVYSLEPPAGARRCRRRDR